MTSVQSGVREYQQFIGGEWIAGEGGTFEDRDPFTGDVVALAPAGHARRRGARDRGRERRRSPPGRRRSPRSGSGSS